VSGGSTSSTSSTSGGTSSSTRSCGDSLGARSFGRKEIMETASAAEGVGGGRMPPPPTPEKGTSTSTSRCAAPTSYHTRTCHSSYPRTRPGSVVLNGGRRTMFDRSKDVGSTSSRGRGSVRSRKRRLIARLLHCQDKCIGPRLAVATPHSQGALQAHRERSHPEEGQVPGELCVDLCGGETRQ